MPLAYIIMPVGSDAMSDSKRSVLEASARSRGWATHFPLDSKAHQDSNSPEAPSFDLSDVLKEMKAAALIVADLSLERPSCYYEVGLAQSMGAPTLLVAIRKTQIHQLAGRENVHFYADLQELSTLVTTALDQHGTGRVNFHVY